MPKIRNDARLARELETAGIDVLVAFSMENVFYLSGALFSLQDNLRDRLAAAGVTGDGRDFLICATNETSAIEHAAHVGELRGYVEFSGTAITDLADLLHEWGYDTAVIGIEKRYLMATYFEELQTRLPRANLVAGDRAIEAARAIKTPEHIEIIGRSSRLTEQALQRTFENAHVGETEKDMALRLLTNMHELGADTVRHAVLTVGDNARHAHPYPSTAKKLDPGDIIRVDVGGLFGGYGTDIARMGIVGDPSDEQHRLYETLRNSQRAVAAALRPGARACDVYQMAVEAYAAQGVPGYRRDHVGHSLSILGGHDEPMLHAGNQTELEENMVMAIEPILRDSAGRRYTVEDTYLVTAAGPQLLTTATDTQTMHRIW